MDAGAAADHLATIITEWQSAAHAQGGSKWTMWYVGHAQGLLGLLRTALAQELPAGVEALARRKHVPRLLDALKHGDRTLSHLADETALDLSYVDREVTRLAAAGAVRTEKQGRERWVTLTASGGSLLDLARRARRGAGATRVARRLDQVLHALEELGQRQQTLEQLVTRAPASDERPSHVAEQAPAFEAGATSGPDQRTPGRPNAGSETRAAELHGNIRRHQALKLQRLVARVEALSPDDPNAAVAVHQAQSAWARLRALLPTETNLVKGRFLRACKRVLDRAPHRSTRGGDEMA